MLIKGRVCYKGFGTESNSCHAGAHLGFLSSGALFSPHAAPACVKDETAKMILPPPGYALSPMASGNSSSGGALASDRLIIAARHSDVGFCSLTLHRKPCTEPCWILHRSRMCFRVVCRLGDLSLCRQRASYEAACNRAGQQQARPEGPKEACR